jgi:hypothetical protein
MIIHRRTRSGLCVHMSSMERLGTSHRMEKLESPVTSSSDGDFYPAKASIRVCSHIQVLAILHFIIMLIYTATHAYKALPSILVVGPGSIAGPSHMLQVVCTDRHTNTLTSPSFMSL